MKEQKQYDVTYLSNHNWSIGFEQQIKLWHITACITTIHQTPLTPLPKDIRWFHKTNKLEEVAICSQMLHEQRTGLKFAEYIISCKLFSQLQ